MEAITTIQNQDYKFKFNIDRGGTFTDIFCEYKSDDQTYTLVNKLLSSDPQNYDDAPAEGIRRIINTIAKTNILKKDKIPMKYIESIRMGTTIATNALLERKGEKCALIITKGFRDVIEIGNQTRPNIFDLKIERPSKLYSAVFEIDERVQILPSSPHHPNSIQVIKPINQDEVDKTLEEIKQLGINSIAVCFVHSYAFNTHEELVKKRALSKGFPNISLSSEIMKIAKLTTRGSTAVLDAYLTPAIKNYVHNFVSYFAGEEKEKLNVLFMQSDGGLTSHSSFIGSKALISGPAAGVVGYAMTTSEVFKNENLPIIGLDMGGTSTDVSRYENGWDHVFESLISGVTINAPQIDVNTVAAGGGSRLFYKNDMYVVGPESSGAHPGPVCYKKNGFLSITDANLILGRIIPKYFPKIFGKNADEELSYADSLTKMQELTSKINDSNMTSLSCEEVALGFVKVANEEMCRPIRSLTQSRGHNPKDHILSIFGGAGGQHACAIAKQLGIKKVFIHKYAGILSAFGLSIANIVEEDQEPFHMFLNDAEKDCIESEFVKIEENIKKKLITLYTTIGEEIQTNDNKIDYELIFDSLGFQITSSRYLLLNYHGNDYNLTIKEDKKSNYQIDFEKAFQREYGFLLENRKVFIDSLRVRIALIPKSNSESPKKEKGQVTEQEKENEKHIPIDLNWNFFEIDGKLQRMETRIYRLEDLQSILNPDSNRIKGPALILSGSSTIVIEPKWTAEITTCGNVIIIDEEEKEKEANLLKGEIYLNGIIEKDSLELSLFANRFMSIAEQMGRHLQRTSVSTNIKERLDFSCALFDKFGNLVANAPHLPVHLGAMQKVVKHQIKLLKDDWKEGEVILCNHPKAGGSHLPDMTVLTPVFHEGKPVFYLGNRGHHSDIGGLTPGSMPSFSKKLEEEGAAIYSLKIIEDGIFKESVLKKIFIDDLISKNLRPTASLSDNLSDLKAQVASNTKGMELLKGLISQHGITKIQAYMKFIQESAENSVRQMLDRFAGEQCGIEEGASGSVRAEDFMDDGSKIMLEITFNRNEKNCHFDFTGTSPQVYGNINTPKSIVYSSIIYCLRCLIDSDLPLNQGCLNPVKVTIPKSSLLSPDPECAVVGGNVTTSQRITDVILKAFKACAASQGDMNNFTFGCAEFGYYETIGGGSGAGPNFNGKSGVQVHMTNTRITDVEVTNKNKNNFKFVCFFFYFKDGFEI